MDGTAAPEDAAQKKDQLQNALAAILENTVRIRDSEGNSIELPRYSHRTTQAVTNAILGRSRELGGYIYQLVRLVRLASFCAAPKPFYAFFWSRQAQILPSYFEGAIAEAVAQNRVPDTLIRIVEEESEKGKKQTAVEFVEPAMCATVEKNRVPFRLYCGNMPPLTALLEIMQDVWGTDTVQAFFAPVVTPEPTKAAEEVARALRKALTEWLSDVLGKSHAARQALFIERYLAHRSALRAGAISDDLILDFWINLAKSETAPQAAGARDSGFKRYSNAATCLLRFDRALRSAIGDAVELDVADYASYRGRPDDPEEAAPPLSRGSPTWRSPIVELTSPPCSSVKWLLIGQLKLLANYLDGCVRALKNDRRDQAGEADDTPILAAGTSYRAAHRTAFAKLTATEKSDGALMGRDRFDLRFTRTLLRVDVFDPAQNKLTEELRKLEGHRLRLPMRDVKAALPSEQEDHYVVVRRAYADIRQHVTESIFASIDHFVERQNDSGSGPPVGAAEQPSWLDADAIKALLLLSARVGSPSLLKYLLGKEKNRRAREDDDSNTESESDETDWADIGDRLCAALAAASGGNTGIADVDDFMRNVKRARNARQGFKAKERLDPLIQDAHAKAAPALILLLDELDKLDLAIDETLRPGAVFAADRQTFAQAFENIYGE